MKDNSHVAESTGIPGLDSILAGGYPAGRPTVIRGASGTGKTLLALAFACHATAKKPPGVVATFDQSPASLRQNIDALDLAPARKKSADLTIIDLRPDIETHATGGDIELGGMLARVGLALEKAGTKRLVFDSFDTLFMAFDGRAQVYLELKRIFDWCRAREITLVATCGEDLSSPYGTALEDYASDASIRLRQSINNRVRTRTLFVQKCRGHGHGTNEYPFMISDKGISVRLSSDTRLTHKASRRTMSTGIKALDAMFGGHGVFEGSITLLSGQAGTGKSLLAASMAADAGSSGRRVHYVTFEESPNEILRNTRSIGLDLQPLVKDGKLTVQSVRSVEHGLEEHLLKLMDEVDEIKPALLILDPITALGDVSYMEGKTDVKAMLLRLTAHLKQVGVTTILTELLPDDALGVSAMNISSMIDTWIRLRLVEKNGEMNRLVHIAKSRGLPGANEIKEFRMTDRGLVIEPPYIGPSGMVFGTEKRVIRARDQRELRRQEREIRRLEIELERERMNLEREESLDRQLREDKQAELEERIEELRETVTEYQRGLGRPDAGDDRHA